MNSYNAIRREIEEVLEIISVDNTSKYLGLPSLWGWSKKETLDYLKS